MQQPTGTESEAGVPEVISGGEEVLDQTSEIQRKMQRLANATSSPVSDAHPDTQLADQTLSYANLISEARTRMRSLDEGLGKDVQSNIAGLLNSSPQLSTGRAAAVKLIEAHSTAIRELSSFLLEIADKGASLGRDLSQTADAISEVGPEELGTREASQTPYSGIPANTQDDTHEGGSVTKAQIPLSPGAQAIKDGFDRILGGDSTNHPMISYGRIPKHA